MLSRIGAGAGALALLALCGCASREESVEVAMSDVPSAVRATIDANLGGGSVREVELEDDRYEVEVSRPDGVVELTIEEDGTLVSTEREEAEGEDDADTGADDEDSGEDDD